MFLCFAHNVARLLNNSLYLSVNLFTARIYSHLQGKALPSFPVVLDSEYCSGPGDRTND